MSAPHPSTFAVIPARGGSKGIPRKNLQVVGGHRLVERSISAALDASRVSRVFVSTDDEEIAAVSHAAGAEVIERPSEISDDLASSESVLLHALDTIEAAEGDAPEICVFLQCTSPFLWAEDIDATVALLDRGNDSAFTAAPSHVFLWRETPDGAVGINHDLAGRARRQDLPPEVAETGGAYAFRVSGFRRSAHRFFGRTAFHLVPSIRALEIDDDDDLVIARALVAHIERGATSGRDAP